MGDHCFLHSFKFFVVYVFHLSVRSIPKDKNIQTIVNEIVSLISFLIYLTLEHRKGSDLPNLLMLSSNVFMIYFMEILYVLDILMFKMGREHLNSIKKSKN